MTTATQSAPITRHPLTERIPDHLKIYTSKQDYSLYTPIDHASWRFIMKIGRHFYAKHAHQKYLDGLEQTGISTEHIPRLDEMDAKLRQFNWRAVAVIGFIPPAAFLEFQSYGLLPIACDMRKIENLNYTPAPDIVHEAAGHAPIIADAAYGEYLRGYGDVARKAIFSKENLDVYEAVRNLSDTKERPNATAAEIEAAQKRLDQTLATVKYDSEVDWVSRLGWWTAEYGLVGPMDNPKIYGAGLLSSIGESYHCLTPEVKKLPLSIDCVHQMFDITRMQPQLYVTPDFETLNVVLDQLADMMAFRKGGLEGLKVAHRGGTLTTTEFENGLQVSGVLRDIELDATNTPIYLMWTGPVQLAYKDKQLPGHDPKYHKDGFGTPVGKIWGLRKSPCDLTAADLDKLGFTGKKESQLEFESGIVVKGVLTNKLERDGKLLVLTFDNCTVTLGSKVLYQPSWGPFDMACGSKIPSVYGGAGDRYAYLVATDNVHYDPGHHKTNATPENKPLGDLYQRVRTIRESGKIKEGLAELTAVHDELEKKFPTDWLLRWELLELNAQYKLNAPWREAIHARLPQIATLAKDKDECISRGLNLLKELHGMA